MLILIPTPIGNLEDITLRALRLLKEVDLILAEDTRTTGKLLKHFQIQQKLQAFHQFNEHKKLEPIIENLKNGTKIALVSDAGTPAISDPGFLLVRACIENNIEVDCLPGATAFVPALVKSGLPSDKFCFEGFLPAKKGRKTQLEKLQTENRTMVFYESPHRILKTLTDFNRIFGAERKISVSRELTKIYEETINGNLAEVLTHFQNHKIKGEFTIVVAGNK